MRWIMPTPAKVICLGMLAASLGLQPVFAVNNTEGQDAASPVTTSSELVVTHRPKSINFEQERASPDVRHVFDWVLDSGNNHGLPFVIIDKKEAKVFVFYADGRLRGAAPALLGSAVGDDSVPGIGDRKLSSIRPEERTTPAGRFVAALDLNLHGKAMLWVDYDAAISMHPVITSNVEEQRAQRLATPTPDDNRISYGCINVPPEFFKKVVGPAFKRTNGIVYVLPEIRTLQQVFAFYDVDERTRLRLAARIDVDRAERR